MPRDEIENLKYVFLLETKYNMIIFHLYIQIQWYFLLCHIYVLCFLN